MKHTLVFILALWALLAHCVPAFSWGHGKKLTHQIGMLEVESQLGLSENPSSNSHTPSIYEVALKELQELESAPLCHRVAARLLVNSCELVDGKDEATILTESEPQVRDFVDAYAASLAICDLQRGSFLIPVQCAMLKEDSLNRMALQNPPQIHLTSSEIDACLTALARSDAAWSTWVSYRHKAVRFCEAARADNEKTQSILLYQKLTRVISKLADGVEHELQKRMGFLHARARNSLEHLDQLNSGIDKLQAELSKVHEYLAGDLRETMVQSSGHLSEGLESAETIQQLLGVLLQSMLESNSRLASSVASREMSMQKVTVKANNDMQALMAVVAGAAASSAALQQQIELSHFQTAELATRQDALEKGMDGLITVSEKLYTKYDDHTQLLEHANNKTYEVLDTLEETVAKAASINDSLHQDPARSGWWPYIVFPTLSLVMGSYGLPPSAFRNLGLLALGEVVGFAYSRAKDADIKLFFSDSEPVLNGTGTSL